MDFIKGFNRLLPILVMAFLLASCASTSKAPASKSDEAKRFETPSDRGTVYLYRTGRALNAAAQLMVKVNSIDAGGTGPGTFFRWELKPGIYTFSSSTGESSAAVQLDVQVGQVYFIRQDARVGVQTGRVSMKEVDSKKGQNEVQNCKLLVSSYIPE
jgi:hypothetical protein